MISIGNMSDVNFSDLISYLTDDPHTTCISLYIEGLKDGLCFYGSRKMQKPIVALKSGVSAHGAARSSIAHRIPGRNAKIYEAPLNRLVFRRQLT